MTTAGAPGARERTHPDGSPETQTDGRAPLQRRLGSAVLLFVFWVALWRTVSPGVVLSGVAVAGFAQSLVPVRARHRRVRPVAALGLGVHILGQLVVATAHVAWEVLTPTDRSRPGTVLVTLPGASTLDLTLVGLLVTLTPGSFVADIDATRRTVLVHVLHLSEEDAVRAQIADLQRRVSAVTVDDRPTPPDLPDPDAGTHDGQGPPTAGGPRGRQDAP